MSKPRKAPPRAIDDALDALRKRGGMPTESDRPRPSTFPGRKIRALPGQINIAGDEEPHRD